MKTPHSTRFACFIGEKQLLEKLQVPFVVASDLSAVIFLHAKHKAIILLGKKKITQLYILTHV